jgi:type I restriction-modification system DNA methylase subunit
MNTDQARQLVRDTFTHGFQKDQFRRFIKELLNRYDESKAQAWNRQYIPDAFKEHIERYERLGTYAAPDNEKLDILIVYLTQGFKLERSRTALRNFVAHHLNSRDEKEAGLVAFVSPTEKTWRFSFVRMEYETEITAAGIAKAKLNLTPARRFSYLVGEGESCHTAQNRFVGLLEETGTSPTLALIAESFSVESVTKEFFREYARLFEDTEVALAAVVKSDKAVRADFQAKGVSTLDFAKKLLGQIVFLYFIQKKGWLGVAKGGNWGDGPSNFMRRLADSAISSKRFLFNDILEPLFYDTLATDRGHDAWCETFQCRVPFLNGGLFEPLAGYEWEKTDIDLPNTLFTNQQISPAGDVGTGILDVFDRYNFTVNEAEPLEKEVAIDPEMLGKVFENLIEENRRKGLGTYYTPREIVHYMCQESLINYLETTLNGKGKTIQGADVEALVREGEQAAPYEAARKEGTVSYRRRLPEPVEKNARALDEALASITVCDPAIGSGAFPVGMMTEIVRARAALTPYFADDDVAKRTAYQFKRHAIENSLYGVDIDAGAVEIAKLRLWLSLVVDEEDVQQIQPLPNLDYKIVVGNSLLGVEKDLFNAALFQRLEELKPRFFNESNRQKKLQYKRQIEDLIHELTNSRKAFDFEIYFSEVFHVRGGFDVVIANPPYGSNIDALLPTLRPLYYEAIRNYADIYKMFMQLGLRKLCRHGIQAFITPNTFLAQPRYKDIRQVLLQNDIVRIVNLGEEVFENVIVPTCLSFIKRDQPSSGYLFADLSKDSKFSGELRATPFRQADLQQVKLSKDLSLYIGTPLRNKELLFAEVLEIKDAGIQYHRSGIGLKNKGGNDLYERLFNSDQDVFRSSIPVWYGRLIDKWFIETRTDEFFNLNYRDVLKANESASFSEVTFKVSPKILWRQTSSRLRAVIDTERRWFRNTIQCAYIKEAYRDKLDIYYVLGIVNSRHIEIAYNAVAREAGRVFPQVKLTHVKKLPIVIADEAKQKEIADVVKQILARKQHDAKGDIELLEREVDRQVYALYGLTDEEIKFEEESRSLGT